MTRIHGHRRPRSRTYAAWAAMHTRCRNPRQQYWRLYGGRGIRVCDAWHDFVAFLADMGECPQGCTLDRIDSNGNYELVNCRWATPAEQSRNTCRNIILQHDGKSMCLKDWANFTGIGYGTLKSRIRYGWPVGRILTERVGRHQGRHSAYQP